MPASIEKFDVCIVSLSLRNVICDARDFTPAACAVMLPFLFFSGIKETR
ncbi:hypothetical protein L579_3817 [Pantoea sp. AS-PWVM4]|nr:hypothetical protein L579_3817 [Pantoea sp. AS-PWVM4]